MPTLLAFFSGQDLLIVAIVALLLFGKRLPSVMRSLGEGVTEFKKGINGEVTDEEEDKTIRKQPPHKLEDRRDEDDDVSNHDVRKFDEVRKPA